MRGIRDFVLHIPNKYNEKFKTEGGLELYGDHRLMAKEMANTIVEVVEVPFGYEGPIEKGNIVFIDPTIVMQGIYKEGVVDSPFLIDRENAWYKASENLIIAYSSDKGKTWKCINDNILMETVKVDNEQVVNGLIRVNLKSSKDNEMIVVLPNEEIKKEGIKEGDSLLVNKDLMVNVKFDGKNLAWLKNDDLFARI